MLAVERSGSGGSPVLCLHGWPGGVSDYRLLTPLLVDTADVVVPHLPGFGDSFAPGDELRPPPPLGERARVFPRLLVRAISCLHKQDISPVCSSEQESRPRRGPRTT